MLRLPHSPTPLRSHRPINRGSLQCDQYRLLCCHSNTKCKMNAMGDVHLASSADRKKRVETNKNNVKDSISGSELWTDGLLCAFEFIQGHKRRSRIKSGSKIPSTSLKDGHSLNKRVPSCEMCGTVINENYPLQSTSLIDGPSISLSNEVSLLDDPIDINECNCMVKKKILESHWVPIGWVRISELVKQVQVDGDWDAQQMDLSDDEADLTVADLAAPYWEQPVGSTWWCHLSPSHPAVDEWLRNAQWLHPAVGIALRDESRLISEKMKHLLYEVPVRVAGGLLFELLGSSAGDPFTDEDDIPIVLRSWQAQNFLITALHVKGTTVNTNVLGIIEVQDLLVAGGNGAPKSAHELIAHLACRLARWDDRLFRKFIFGAADEVELKFVHRRNQEDLNLLSIILNQEIRRLSTAVIRVKWTLHAREEIVFELLQHLRGYVTKRLLEGIRESTRAMIEEQEAVRGRLFTIQDVMQSAVRAWLQDKSIRVTHNLAVFGGCGLVLSIITGLFGINVDGIPGNQSTPYAFALFAGIIVLLGVILIGLGMLCLGLRKPITEDQVKVRKLELQRLIKSFQHDAETHAKFRQDASKHELPPSASNFLPEGADYILIDGGSMH